MADLFRFIDEADEPKKDNKTPTLVPGLVLVSRSKSIDEGTHYLDKFVATYKDLKRVLGEPNREGSADGKVSVGWAFVYNGHFGNIYDWKEAESPRDNPTDRYEWHIGGKNNAGLWTYDLEEDIFEVIADAPDDKEEDEERRPISTADELREWFHNSRKDVRHLVEQYYYEDLYSLTKDQLCDWLVENKDELEDIMKDDDVVIDVNAIRDHIDVVDDADLISFDNFYLEGELTGVIDIQDELLNDPMQEDDNRPTKHVECSADYIGCCDLCKVHDEESIWGAELKVRCNHVSFSIKDDTDYVSGDLVDLERLSYLVECAVSNGQAQFALTDSFVNHPELKLLIDLDDSDVITMTLYITVDEPEVVDEINNSEPYDSEEDDFNVICDNGDCFTYHTYKEAVDKAKQFANTWKVEKVSYGVKNNERDFIRREDVWVPGEGRVVPEKTIYEQLEELN